MHLDLMLTESELRLVRRLVNEERRFLDQRKQLVYPNSPQEASLLADILDIEHIREKLAGR